MHRNLTHHAWMHRNRHSWGITSKILPLTHECTEIIISQVHAQESFPLHMNDPKSSSLKWMHRNPTPYEWMHRNHHPSSKCTGILPLTHECNKIVTPRVNAPKSYPSHMNAPKSSSLKCTGILHLTHECTEIVTPQVNAPKSYPSSMNAPKSSCLK